MVNPRNAYDSTDLEYDPYSDNDISASASASDCPLAAQPSVQSVASDSPGFSSLEVELCPKAANNEVELCCSVLYCTVL